MTELKARKGIQNVNKQELATISKKAAKVANHSIDFVVTEDRKGNVSSRGINIDGRLLWSVDDFYSLYPQTASQAWLESHASDLLERGWIYQNGTLQNIYSE